MVITSSDKQGVSPIEAQATSLASISAKKVSPTEDYSSRARATQGDLIMSQMEAIRELEVTAESEYQDRSIRCVDCNENFVWTAGEQVFFHDKGLKNEPKRCKPCKQAKNERLAAITAAQASGIRQRVEVSVQCAQCGQQTTVPFYPSQGRPVYCRSCFLANRTTDAADSHQREDL